MQQIELLNHCYQSSCYIYVTSFAKIKSYIFLVTSKLGWHQSCRKFKICYNLPALGSKKFKPKQVSVNTITKKWWDFMSHVICWKKKQISYSFFFFFHFFPVCWFWTGKWLLGKSHTPVTLHSNVFQYSIDFILKFY